MARSSSPARRFFLCSYRQLTSFRRARGIHCVENSSLHCFLDYIMVYKPEWLSQQRHKLKVCSAARAPLQQARLHGTCARYRVASLRAEVLSSWRTRRRVGWRMARHGEGKGERGEGGREGEREEKGLLVVPFPLRPSAQGEHVFAQSWWIRDPGCGRCQRACTEGCRSKSEHSRGAAQCQCFPGARCALPPAMCTSERVSRSETPPGMVAHKRALDRSSARVTTQDTIPHPAHTRHL
ncbi:hypothetical protein DFH06DRAFT_55222 [Mycena polygramma]|nr:hypothetical protein DFH06DRAFT_55222 [Mycena polygramma]